MNLKCFLIVCVLIFAIFSGNASAQGVTIGANTTFTLGGATISLSHNWSNSGTFTAGTGTVVFNGASGNQTITNASGEIFNNLVVNKAAGDLQLVNNITVNGTLTLTGGDIDMNTKTLTLGSNASLSESAGNTVKGSGILTTTRTLNAPASVNLLGAEITSAANLGSTVINRGHTQQSSGGNNSVLRYFEFTPTTNTGLNASIVFHYDDSELNSLTESELVPFRSEDGGTSWTLIGGSSCNTSTNTVTYSGLNSLSCFTLAASTAPLPVELVSFSAEQIDKCIRLTWCTATEIDNYGFDVERSLRTNKEPLWERIAFVHGCGNSNSSRVYNFTDANPPSGSLVYRLKQLDTDGHCEYFSTIAEVSFESLPEQFTLMQNYPNPFNMSTKIRYNLPQHGFVKLIIFDQLGNEIAALVNDEKPAGEYQVDFNTGNLSSGIYYYRLSCSGYTETKKLILLK